MLCRQQLVIFATLVVFLSVWEIAAAARIRYREGTLNGETCSGILLEQQENVTVHEARMHCQSLPSCISFSFVSLQKVPTEPVVLAQFFKVSDWHAYPKTGLPCFLENLPEWHTYINQTRETNLVSHELNRLENLWFQLANKAAAAEFYKQPSQKLRRSQPEKNDMIDSDGGTQLIEQQINILYSVFSVAVVQPVLAAPQLVPWMIQLSTQDTDAMDVSIRQFALTVLVVLADSKETQKNMIPAIAPMKQLFLDSDDEANSTLHKSALDVISNMCIHSDPDDPEWQRSGVAKFLTTLLKRPDFIGIQAAIALTHLKQQAIHLYSLPSSTIRALIELMGTTLDGDIAYDIQWELVPGPLSALFHYLELRPAAISDELVREGILPPLLRILEESSSTSSASQVGSIIKPMETQMAWQFLWTLAQVNESARQSLVFSEDLLQTAHDRIMTYVQTENMASSLLRLLNEWDASRMEL